MNKKEIYDRIVDLTQQLAETGVPASLLDAASYEDLAWAQDEFDYLISQKSDLYEQIAELGKEINEAFKKDASSVQIFGNKEDMYKFDTKKIDAVSFYVLTLYGDIEDMCLFENTKERIESEESFLSALDDEYEQLADFARNHSWKEYVDDNGDYTSICSLLVDIFDGYYDE